VGGQPAAGGGASARFACAHAAAGEKSDSWVSCFVSSLKLDSGCRLSHTRCMYDAHCEAVEVVFATTYMFTNKAPAEAKQPVVAAFTGFVSNRIVRVSFSSSRSFSPETSTIEKNND
jgi:hypothetical protein